MFDFYTNLYLIMCCFATVVAATWKYQATDLQGCKSMFLCQMDLYVQGLVSFSVLKTVLYLPLITVLILFYIDKNFDIDIDQNSIKISQIMIKVLTKNVIKI